MSEEGRIPPQAIEVEEGVLGSCLMEPEAKEIIISELGTDPEVFYKPAHKLIYEAMLELNGKDAAIDMLSIENALRDQNKLAPVGGSGYIQDLTRQTIPLNNLEYHCRILLEKSVKRGIIQRGTNVTSMAYDSGEDVHDVLEVYMRGADEAADLLYKRQGNTVKEVMQETLDDITHRREHPGISGVPTGMPLDKYTGGWQDGNFYIIAARPSIGKTAFALQAAFNAALFASERYRTVPYIWNGEMINKDILKRRLAAESRVNFTKMRDGKVSDIEMKRIMEAAGYIYNADVIIDDKPGISIHELSAKYKTAVRRKGAGLLVVDYLQLMTGKKDGNREQEISSISRGLKALAKETMTPVVALSQLSREPERREGAEPFLSDLRESGSLEQDADGVIMLNRPEFFGHKIFKNKPTENKGHVKVEKMRNGMTGDFWMNFVKTFAEWQSENPHKETGGAPGDNVEIPRAPIPVEFYEDDDQWTDDAPF